LSNLDRSPNAISIVPSLIWHSSGTHLALSGFDASNAARTGWVDGLRFARSPAGIRKSRSAFHVIGIFHVQVADGFLFHGQFVQFLCFGIFRHCVFSFCFSVRFGLDLFQINDWRRSARSLAILPGWRSQADRFWFYWARASGDNGAAFDLIRFRNVEISDGFFFDIQTVQFLGSFFVRHSFYSPFD
jgi:hypothetical protein